LKGWWVYNSEKMEKPKVTRYCAIYETEGDKRLGDHVIIGLERLFPLLLPNFQSEQVLSVFPPSRVENQTVMETWMTVLMDDEGMDLVDIVTSISLPENPPVFPEGVSEHNRTLWDSFVATLKSALPIKEGRIPPYFQVEYQVLY
jgi:hypothetical protein